MGKTRFNFKIPETSLAPKVKIRRSIEIDITAGGLNDLPSKLEKVLIQVQNENPEIAIDRRIEVEISNSGNDVNLPKALQNAIDYKKDHPDELVVFTESNVREEVKTNDTPDWLRRRLKDEIDLEYKRRREDDSGIGFELD